MMKPRVKLMIAVIFVLVSGCEYDPYRKDIDQGYSSTSRPPGTSCHVCPFGAGFEQGNRPMTTSSSPKSYGKVNTFYGKAKSASLTGWQKVFEGEEVLEKYARMIDEQFYIKAPLTLATKECGKIDAYYGRTTPAELVFCYELIRNIADRALKDYPLAEAGDVADSAFKFIVLHEMSHALIDVLRLDFTGREEEVADQISAYTLLTSQHPEWHLRGTRWYFEKGERNVGEEALANEHLLDKQRMYNLMCWAYGSDSVKFYEFREHFKNRGCEREFRQMKAGIEKLLSPHVR